MYLSANVVYLDGAHNDDVIGRNRFAAIVTKVLPGGNVHLTVFPPNTDIFTVGDVPHISRVARGDACWVWPERYLTE